MEGVEKKEKIKTTTKDSAKMKENSLFQKRRKDFFLRKYPKAIPQKIK